MTSGFALEPIGRASVDAHVYERVRRLIVSDEISAGTRLHQTELAELLGASRTPVREALRRLTGDGSVAYREQHGFRVAELHLDDALRRLEVRCLLEPGGARLAAERRAAGDLRAMAAAISNERSATEPGAIHDASRTFHIAVARASGNRELVLTLEMAWLAQVGRRLIARRHSAPDWRLRDADEHQAILDAIRAGDAALAERLTSEHLQTARRDWEVASHA